MDPMFSRVEPLSWVTIGIISGMHALVFVSLTWDGCYKLPGNRTGTQW